MKKQLYDNGGNELYPKVLKGDSYTRRIPFTIDVDCIIPFSDDWNTPDTINNYVQQVVYSDNAVLYLPTNYSPTGTPSRLIIYCKHGASVVEPTEDPVFDAGDERIFHFLISLGYAILAVDGVPNDYAALIGISERVVGNYISIQSVRKAYEYVIYNYNIAQDGCFVYGWSQGGHYAQNVVDLCGLPVLACAEASPVCSYQFHQWDLAVSGTVGGVNWTHLARLNIARLFDFPTVTTDAQLSALQFDESKVNGYDPWTRNVENPYSGFVKSGDLWVLPSGTTVESITTMKKHLKAPLKIWAATNDPSLSCDVMRVYIQAAKNAGCVADMHLFNTGGHNIAQAQSAISGKTFVDNGVTYSLYPIAVEIARWYRDFGGLDFEE